MKLLNTNTTSSISLQIMVTYLTHYQCPSLFSRGGTRLQYIQRARVACLRTLSTNENPCPRFIMKICSLKPWSPLNRMMAHVILSDWYVVSTYREVRQAQLRLYNSTCREDMSSAIIATVHFSGRQAQRACPEAATCHSHSSTSFAMYRPDT